MRLVACDTAGSDGRGACSTADTRQPTRKHRCPAPPSEVAAWCALALGVTALCVIPGTVLARQQTQNAAFAETMARAERGDADAQFRLGRMYLDGDGVPQDYVQSVAWFRKAASQGHPKAQNNLGIAFEKGLGVPKDDALAVEWYRQAADHGEMIAQSNLGVMYSSGHGVPQDLAQAVAWYRKAAAQGFGEAQFFLGQAYSLGSGVPQDDAEAVAWWRKSAEQNDAYALYNLGLMYKGGRGVPQDPVEAYKFLILGLETEAKQVEQQKTLADNREALARSLTAGQRAEAERRVREWTEAHVVRQTPRPPSPAEARPELQLAQVSVTPQRVSPGGSFMLDIAYTATDPTGSPKAAVTLSFSILSGGTALFEPPGEIVESDSGAAWKISKPLTAAATLGTYVIRVRMALGATVVTRDVEFEIAR